MIPNITKGSTGLGKLLKYLFGPGDREEHRDQHVVAGYDLVANLEPERDASGAVDIGPLADDLAAPRRTNLQNGKPGRKEWIWHCSLSLPAEEGQLPDEKWQEIAEQFVERMGLATPGESGCRWVAVRHGLSVNGNDHVHLVVTLARMNGEPVRMDKDFSRAQKVCRNLEKEHGLMRLAVSDGRSSRTASSQMELARKDAAGAEVTDREWLRQAVRVAAANTGSESEWVANMRAVGLMISVRPDKKQPDRVAGYAVARPVPAGEKAFWCSGRKLDGEMSVVKMRERWPAGTELTVSQWRDETRPGPAAVAVPAGQRIPQWQDATRRIRTAMVEVAGLDPVSPDVDLVARVTADVMVQVAWLNESRGSGRLTSSADDLSRAAVPARRAVPAQPSDRGRRLARELSAIGRAVTAVGGTRSAAEVTAMLALMAAVARLASAIRDLRQAAGRDASASAATRSGTRITPVIARGNKATARPVQQRGAVAVPQRPVVQPGRDVAERD